MKKYYSIKELCQLTMLSVRTLHHYDEMNLLKPSHRTEKGHRRYSEDNLLRLQQIVTLKFMGHTLKEIKTILHQKDFNIFDSLKIQEKALLEQISYIQKINKLINYLIIQHELHQPVDWKIVIKIIEVLKLNNVDHQQWYEKYLNASEQQQYNLQGLAYMDKWQSLFEEVKSNLNSNFTDNRDVEIVKKWISIANESYGNQPELINKLWEAFKAGIIPAQLPNDIKVIAYITRAFEKLQT